jgi:hypothetical protein
MASRRMAGGLCHTSPLLHLLQQPTHLCCGSRHDVEASIAVLGCIRDEHLQGLGQVLQHIPPATGAPRQPLDAMGAGLQQVHAALNGPC